MKYRRHTLIPIKPRSPCIDAYEYCASHHEEVGEAQSPAVDPFNVCPSHTLNPIKYHRHTLISTIEASHTLTPVGTPFHTLIPIEARA